MDSYNVKACYLHIHMKLWNTNNKNSVEEILAMRDVWSLKPGTYRKDYVKCNL